MPRSQRRWLVWSLAFVLGGAACAGDEDTILLVRADLQPRGQVSGAITLAVTVSDEGQHSDSHSFTPRTGDRVEFPTSFSLQLPRGIRGPIRLSVSALDMGGTVVAAGQIDRLEIQVGKRQDASIDLACRRGCLPEAPDGGAADAPVDAATDTGPSGRTCGNGMIDDQELCDPGILAGRPGACPRAGCNDDLACTSDRVVGYGCRMTCEHTPITAAAAGDGCCPAGANAAQDPDCSSSCGNGQREAAETCDTQIAEGQPGSCPLAGRPDTCSDGDPCTRDTLLSAGTCAAACAHHPILSPAAGDQCCPPGGTTANDPDCPAVCGNRRRDPGETCDRAAPAGSAEACPTTCQDTDPCTTDVLVGSGCQVTCQHVPVTRRAGGDLCCPMGATRDVDSDCPARCNNGIVEPGEACDAGIAAGMPGACPTACPMASACILWRLEGRAEDCSARCVDEPSTLCAPQADGCCPTGCTAGQDPDCSPTCNNGVVEMGETCELGIAAGAPGACPTRCDDGNSCTVDRLVSQGTCNARCVYSPITSAMSGDGCCPTGGTALLDSDCPSVCGNRLVEPPRESCDVAVPDGSPGACPTACPQLPQGCFQPRLSGSAMTCNVLCELDPIKACATGDGCCPEGCDRKSDEDCAPVCGNAVLEPGEVCDRGLTAGKPGACPALCDDYDACTVDITLGRISDCTRQCVRQPVTRCAGGDGCCPAGCTADQDADCKTARCGNGIVEAGETCDPRTSCPTTCPDDGDPCTSSPLRGDLDTCTAHCEHEPILACSGARDDKCCPTGCTAALDVDCSTPAKALP